MRASPIQVSFAAGQLDTTERIDLAAYPAGCRRLENFAPKRQGPATRRPGTYYVRPIKDPSERTWLAEFVFDENDAYVMEFGDRYIRLFTQGGVVEQSPGVPFEISTPWTSAELTNSDGTFALQLAQSADVIWISSSSHQTRKLSRRAALDWLLEVFSPNDGPFADENKSVDTVQASAATGTATLTASSAIFTAGHVSSLFQISDPNPNQVVPWEADVAVSIGDVRRSEGKVYRATTAGTTGGDKPVHEEGIGSDGVVDWRYQNDGAGVMRITSYISPTSVSGTILVVLPDAVVNDPTEKWAFGAWSSESGWPYMVAFYRSRLAFGRNDERWYSKSDDFNSFAPKTGGQILDDNAFRVRITARRRNVGRWFIDADRMVDGSNGGESTIGKITETEPFGPENVEAKPATAYGSNGVFPLLCHDRVLFVDRSGTTLREMVYSFESDRDVAPDLTRLAESVLGAGVVDTAWQDSPVDIVWCVLADGNIAGLTYDPNDAVFGWHVHRLGGGLRAEAIAAIPNANTTGSEVWFIVNDGVGRSVVRMTDFWRKGRDPSDAFFVDFGLTYEGAPTKVVTGLDHLEGRKVAVLADGAVPFSPENRPIVTSGQISIPFPASKVHVGLPYESWLTPMQWEAGAPEGTARGRRKGIHKVYITVEDTRGLLVGSRENDLFYLDRRSPATPMGTAEPLTTGELEANAWPGGFSRDPATVIFTDEPLPATITAIAPRINTHD